MERIIVTRGEAQGPTPESLSITIRMKPRLGRIALRILASLLCAAGVFKVLQSLLRGESLTPSSALTVLDIIILVCLGIAQFLLLGRLAWSVLGRERYTINPLSLSIRRSIGPLAFHRTYRFADLDGAQIIPRPGTLGLPPWKCMCLETEGSAVLLRHLGHDVRLGVDLDKAEGAYLLSAIGIWMQPPVSRSGLIHRPS